MRRSLIGVVCVLALVLAAAPVFAQGGSGAASLVGVVLDSGGGFVPGATVLVKNNATGAENKVISNNQGAFSVPSLDPGTYMVTVSLQGFKTAVFNDMRLLTATPTNIKATLEVGALSETVEVKGGVELVNTQTNAVSSTMSIEQISNLPLVSRNALNAVTFLPGVDTIGGPRNSTISGLPQNTINITIDGISNSNNLQSGDGFFSMVTPRLDAVEEVTVTGATPGADRAGQGAVNIAFVTRSGSNRYDSSIYHYWRNPAFNTNYWFNIVRGLDRNDVNVHQYGGRVGGPIVLPGLVDGRGKAFFFFNMEHFRQPTEVTRTRTILNERAMTGVFAWNVTSGGVTMQRTINLLDLARDNGQITSVDPTIAALLLQIRAAAQTTGNINTPATATNTQSYVYQAPSLRNEYAPTGRVDFNLTPKHRLTGAYYWQRFHSNPDILNEAEPAYPGFPNYGIQASYRTTGSVTLRSTLGSGLVNEMKGGWQWSPVDFFSNLTKEMFDNQGGFILNVPLFTGLTTDSTGASNPQPRNTINWNIDNTLNWLRGNHSWTMGASLTQIIHNQNSRSVVPSATIGLDTNNDPARLMFNNVNILGASNNDLASARSLYALLTGRITSIGGTARLNNNGEYVYLGNLNSRSKMNEIGLFAQDSWRMTPTFTLNYGARYELMLPFSPITPTFTQATMADLCGVSGIGSGPEGRECNLFQPGSLSGSVVTPQYVLYEPGKGGYKTDWDNVAPNIGVNWRPNVQGGFLRQVLGDPDQATLRAGYSLSFNRERMDRFTGLFGGNPGGTTPATRSVGNNNLVYPGESWPVLLRDRNRLGPPSLCPPGTVAASCMAASPTFPITATTANDVNIFAPDLEIPYTESWSIGWQRALSRNMAFELRYVGNRNKIAWTTENWNAPNIFENGFLDEFRLAQANLRANLEAGRGSSFAYFGAGTGTSPLPTYLAYFQGLGAAAAQNAANYTSTNFTNSAWTGHLGYFEPDPFDAANDLHASGTFRGNALAGGVVPNYFVMNPAIDDANITRAAAGSRYHSLQFDLRRRLSQGLTATFNYTHAIRYGSSLQDLHLPRFYLRSTSALPHAFKWTWLYNVPIGRGQRIGTDWSRWLDTVLGGWEFSGTGRVQWQWFSIGGVKLVGLSEKELQKAFKIRIVKNPDTGVVTVFDMPQDMIDNTRRAFNTSPSSLTHYGADGPPEGRYLAPASDFRCIALFAGDCGAKRQILLRAPAFTRVDMRLKKRFPIAGRAYAELDVEVLNVFDNINFNYNVGPGGGTGTFQVTSAYTDINTTYDPGGRIGQIVWRVSW